MGSARHLASHVSQRSARRKPAIFSALGLAVVTGIAVWGLSVGGLEPAASDVAAGDQESASVLAPESAATAGVGARPVEAPGQWFSHGAHLILDGDGTGELGLWNNAFDGTRIFLAHIRAPGSGGVLAEVTRVDKVGAGALAPNRVPAIGGIIAIDPSGVVGSGSAIDPVKSQGAIVVGWASDGLWSQVNLCPLELDSERMNALRCGA